MLMSIGDLYMGAKEIVESYWDVHFSRDWDEMAEISWPIEQRTAIQEELEGYTFLRGVLVEEPVDVSDIVVQGEVATCSLEVKGKAVIGKSRWSREFTVTFRKHQGRWLIDAEPTRDAINDAR